MHILRLAFCDLAVCSIHRTHADAITYQRRAETVVLQDSGSHADCARRRKARRLAEELQREALEVQSDGRRSHRAAVCGRRSNLHAGKY